MNMPFLGKLSDCWLAWYVIVFPVLTLQENPKRITTCSCRYQNLTYDLSPLAMTNDEPRFTCIASAGYLFSYNPCLPFTQPNQTGSPNCTNVAICYWSDQVSDYHLAYGYQHYIHCVLRDGKVALRYRYKEGLYSYVKLICNKSQTDIKNAFKLISGTTEPVFEVNHKYVCPRETQQTNASSNKEDVWFWTAIGESIILFLIIFVGIITCIYQSCKDQDEPLMEQVPPENPNHQPLIVEPNDDVIPYNLIPPPDDFNVQPQRPQQDQPAPVRNEGGQNGEPGREEEPRNEPVDDEPDVHNEPLARPNDQRNENGQVEPEGNGFNALQGYQNGQLVVEAQNEPERASHQGVVRIPVERSATSDEDSMH